MTVTDCVTDDTLQTESAVLVSLGMGQELVTNQALGTVGMMSAGF